MKRLTKLTGRLAVAAIAGAVFVSAGTAGVAAEKAALSDKAVKSMMTSAFKAMPDHIKRGEKVVKIEKDKPEKVLVPVADARRIMKAAGISALAELCGQTDLALSHRNAVLALEVKSRKWSDQQIKFMERLHLVKVLDTLAAKDAKDEADAKKKTAALAKKLCSPKIVQQIRTKVKATEDAVTKN